MHNIKKKNIYFQWNIYEPADDEAEEKPEDITQSVGSTFKTLSGSPAWFSLFWIELNWSGDKLLSLVKR